MTNFIKIKSYYGLAVRARKIAFGCDKMLENAPFLMVYAESLSKSYMSRLENFAAKNKIKTLKLTEKEMFNITENQRILAFGVLDKGLSEAIINNYSFTLED